MKRVLIIDNDPDVLDVMKEALTYENFEVACISDTNNIFVFIALYRPDLIIMDHLLDGINGGELCREVKQHPKTQQLPVIIISAYPYERLPLDSYGCDDFIAKPFDLYDLVDRIKKLTYKGLHVV